MKRTLALLLLCTLLLTGCRYAVSVPQRPTAPDLGLSLGTRDVTATGLTLVWTRAEDGFRGDLTFGDDYWLERQKKGEWVPVRSLLKEACFSSLGYEIQPGTTRETTVNWSALYGTLRPGRYRIAKSLDAFRSTKGSNNYNIYAEFEIE